MLEDTNSLDGAQIILLLNMIGDETFNIMLTNNVVSFEQLSSDILNV